MTAEELLHSLEGVRRSGEGWMARCPAHEDRTASLSIGVGNDGRVLLTCFAGCSAYEIVSAIGLSLSDLFPPRTEREYGAPSRPVRHYALDLLRVLALESRIVACAAGTLANGEGISADDYARLEEAEHRIAEIAARACA